MTYIFFYFTLKFFITNNNSNLILICCGAIPGRLPYKVVPPNFVYYII